jgi:tetratricopeptide (TPR) repeat protein
MKNKTLSYLGMALLMAVVMNVNGQQLKMPAPSPTQTLKQNFGLGEIDIEYSRPGLKGRTAFGQVVPYDQLWRTGANSCTKITFTDNVKVEGNAVPSGTYALFTIPGKTEWTIILNKNTNQGGTGDYKQAEDLLRFKVKPMSMNDKVESLTMNVADVAPTSSNIELLWEKTRVAFNVTESIDSTMMKNIETALSPADKRPYFQAASYYFENGKDLNQALTWAGKAMEQNPKAFYVAHLKAKIQLKLKDYNGAIATAETSIALAKDAKNDDYVRMNEKLIEEAKKGGK